ncbi:MAG: F0F1 ATP synthase subunit A [Pseudonocardia sp.]|nr:F0F1 ATP synthase subunit A [Pseudonocardia sp.]
MTTAILAAEEGGIQPGEHSTVQIAGLTFNVDTIIATLVAALIVTGAGLYMARRATKGRPSGLQIAFEALTSWVRTQTREGMGLRTPKGVIALAVTLFAFILVANALVILPIHHYLPPPTADVNLVYAMTVFVFVWVWAAGLRARGPARWFGHLAHGGVAMVPIEIITVFGSRPISLALRLWGNIFAGGIMVSIIGLIPWYINWAPTAVWKLFDLFIGIIQALIFALLTIIYFSDSVGSDDHAEAH